jgi:hypothetical protein
MSLPQRLSMPGLAAHSLLAQSQNAPSHTTCSSVGHAAREAIGALAADLDPF